ncbi:hypothetical protein BDZ89DRAFT_1133548 [Hymenopellis radicata]|nr:hypothetical protein BDZ89DRAFT_1133548 [Hymenopellis radicata]
MVPPLSSPLDTYLRTQFSTQAAWVDIVRNSDYSIGGVSLGAAYRLFLQHRVVLDVCQALALNINSPSTAYAEVYSEGTSDPSFTITVTDIMNWSGRASGTYRNNKSLMQRTVAAIQVIQNSYGLAGMKVMPQFKALYAFSQAPEVLIHEDVAAALAALVNT